MKERDNVPTRYLFGLSAKCRDCAYFSGKVYEAITDALDDTHATKGKCFRKDDGYYWVDGDGWCPMWKADPDAKG